MVVDVEIKLELKPTEGEVEMLKELAESSGLTIEEVLSSSIKRVLHKKAGVPEEGFKTFEVNVTE